MTHGHIKCSDNMEKGEFGLSWDGGGGGVGIRKASWKRQHYNGRPTRLPGH